MEALNILLWVPYTYVSLLTTFDSATQTVWLIIIAQKASPGKDQLWEPAVLLVAACHGCIRLVLLHMQCAILILQTYP